MKLLLKLSLIVAILMLAVGCGATDKEVVEGADKTAEFSTSINVGPAEILPDDSKFSASIEVGP